MKSYAFCPISDKQINERVARLNAAFTLLILIVFGITQNIFPIAFLMVDFLLRAIPYSKLSLIGISSRNIVRYLSVGENLINAGPKIFAARIGLLMSALIIITYILTFYVVSWVLAGILILFSFLEALFGICVACEIYPFIYRLLYKQNYPER